ASAAAGSSSASSSASERYAIRALRTSRILAPRAARARLPSAFVALLTASALHKDVGGRPLLRGVSFKLERRERMTLAGRNGAGKTTLLRMLAGHTAIDRGELSVA